MGVPSAFYRWFHESSHFFRDVCKRIAKNMIGDQSGYIVKIDNNMKSSEAYYENYRGVSLNPRRQILSLGIKYYASFSKGRVLDLGCWNGDFLRMIPAG
jgi:hypothetical protein